MAKESTIPAVTSLDAALARIVSAQRAGTLGPVTLGVDSQGRATATVGEQTFGPAQTHRVPLRQVAALAIEEG